MHAGFAESFGRLNGEHSFKKANPGAFVEYSARRRHGGRVMYFNFALAREMGLITSEDRLTAELSEVILDTFSLVIINEWDLERGRRFRHKDIKPGRYMATRYLQLQHPSRVGKTSGDGRGIWNGEITHRGVTWDVMSSGTGATCLSPATAIEGRYFKSGDPKVCYGNGYNSIDDGLSAALMSEILHQEGVSTERTLALIVFPGGSSINVRAGRNLLRPSHLFAHLKQGNLDALTHAVHYCMGREKRNGRLTRNAGVAEFCERVALDFARASARYQSDYIFCWMDWDGDNILCDGGIIDYGSIRKFGGYHAGYRYDDGDRYSTCIGEQRGRARYIVQTFAQILDFVTTGRKRPIADFSRDPLLKVFDAEFELQSRRRLLWKMGLTQAQIDAWTQTPIHRARTLTQFTQAYQRLERQQCAHGTQKVPDGETTHAVYVMSRFLREYPGLWDGRDEMVGTPELSSLCRSKYARRRDFVKEPQRWADLERAYRTLASETLREGSLRSLLREWRMRASVRNPVHPVTGDGILAAMEELLKLPRSEAQPEIARVITRLGSMTEANLRSAKPTEVLGRVLRQLEKYGEGI